MCLAEASNVTNSASYLSKRSYTSPFMAEYAQHVHYGRSAMLISTHLCGRIMSLKHVYGAQLCLLLLKSFEPELRDLSMAGVTISLVARNCPSEDMYRIAILSETL